VRLVVLAVIAIVSVAAAAGSQAAVVRPTYVNAARLFDGERMLRGGASVEVRGGRIVAAGRLRIPRGAKVTRLGDATILPGFIDLHVHQSPAVLLREGVTTTRNLGEQLSTLRPPYADAGYPRIVAAGPLITVPGGYPTRRDPPLAAPVGSAEEAVALVDRLVRSGAAVIKIALETGADASLPTLSVPEVQAIVAEAHRLHRIVTAHVLEGPGLAIALAGGVDEVAHMPCTGVTPDQLAQLAARHIPVVGTLHAGGLFASLGSGCGDGLANAKRFVADGGELLYGTDTPAVPAALDLTELGLMQRAGLTAVQVLQAATSRAGRELGMAPLGTLRAGAPADVWAVRGDPTVALRALGRPLYVMARGRRVR